jgi:hypothetical protein
MDDLIAQVYNSIAQEIRQRFPALLVSVTTNYGEMCIDLGVKALGTHTAISQPFQVVFDGGKIKIVCYLSRYVKPGSRCRNALARNVLYEYDITPPDSDLEPLFEKIELFLTRVKLEDD